MPKFKLKKQIDTIAESIPKRIKFIIGSTLLGAIYFLITNFGFGAIPYLALPFCVLVYIVVWFCVYDKIERVEWVALFTTTIMLSLSWYVFFYLIPIRFVSRVTTTVIYTLSVYVSIAVANVLNVSVDRNLQLYKVALTFNKILQLATIYFFAQILQAFELGWFALLCLVFVILFINSMQFYWSCDTKLSFDSRNYGFALLTSIFGSFIFVLCTFIPFINISARSIIFSGFYYIVTSIFELHYEKNQNLRKIDSFVYLLLFLLLICLLTTVW